MSASTETTTTTQVYRVYIKASAQAIWDAITKTEWTERYGYTGIVHYDLRPGGEYRVHATPGFRAGAEARGNVIEVIHNRTSATVPIGQTGVEILIETRDAAHIEELVGRHIGLDRWTTATGGRTAEPPLTCDLLVT